MDLATISQELNKRFLAPLPEFYKRRIVVWYDEKKEFEDQIGKLELQDAKVLCVTGNNYFEIKKTLAVDEPSSLLWILLTKIMVHTLRKVTLWGWESR